MSPPCVGKGTAGPVLVLRTEVETVVGGEDVDKGRVVVMLDDEDDGGGIDDEVDDGATVDDGERLDDDGSGGSSVLKFSSRQYLLPGMRFEQLGPTIGFHMMKALSLIPQNAAIDAQVSPCSGSWASGQGQVKVHLRVVEGSRGSFWLATRAAEAAKQLAMVAKCIMGQGS